MFSRSLITILGVAAAISAMPPHPPTLAADDVVLLLTDGNSQIMKAAVYDALEDAAAAPASTTYYNQTGTPAAVRPRGGCDQSTEVQVTSDERFLNWDVPISPVVSSQGNTRATAVVTSGYEITNRLQIERKFTFLGRKALNGSLSLNLDKTWRSTQERSLRFEVPNGKFGVIVSQPYVRRIQGNVFSDCTDNPTTTPFMADTYESQSYGDLTWVKGVIRLCSSDTYPIRFCIGEGQHN